MMQQAPPRRVSVCAAGRLVAWCDIVPTPSDRGGAAEVRLELAHGHVPTSVRRELLDGLLDEAADAGISRLFIAAPLGDELVEMLHDPECPHTVTRAAGATCLIETRVDCVAGRCPRSR